MLIRIESCEECPVRKGYSHYNKPTYCPLKSVRDWCPDGFVPAWCPLREREVKIHSCGVGYVIENAQPCVRCNGDEICYPPEDDDHTGVGFPCPDCQKEGNP